jgi:hypothetical protein
MKIIWQRRKTLMKRNKVTTWADGFGVWHAKVHLAIATPSDTLPIDSVRRVARRAIRREVEARQIVGQGYRFNIEVDKTDLGADNRFYSITFREKV